MEDRRISRSVRLCKEDAFLVGEGMERVFYRGFKVIAIVFQQALDCCLLETVDWIGCVLETNTKQQHSNKSPLAKTRKLALLQLGEDRVHLDQHLLRIHYLFLRAHQPPIYLRQRPREVRLPQHASSVQQLPDLRLQPIDHRAVLLHGIEHRDRSERVHLSLAPVQRI